MVAADAPDGDGVLGVQRVGQADQRGDGALVQQRVGLGQRLEAGGERGVGDGIEGEDLAVGGAHPHLAVGSLHDALGVEARVDQPCQRGVQRAPEGVLGDDVDGERQVLFVLAHWPDRNGTIAMTSPNC